MKKNYGYECKLKLVFNIQPNHDEQSYDRELKDLGTEVASLFLSPIS